MWPQFPKKGGETHKLGWAIGYCVRFNISSSGLQMPKTNDYVRERDSHHHSIS